MVDIYIIDLFVIGILLLMVTLGSGWIARLPLSFALIYLVVGILLGPYGFGLIQLRRDDVFNAEPFYIGRFHGYYSGVELW